MGARFIEIVEQEESFEFTPPGYDSVLILRRLTPDALEDIDTPWRRWEQNRVTGRREHVIPPNLMRDRNRDLWDYLIRDWRGVKNAKGEDVPCSIDAKWALPGEIKFAVIEVVDTGNISGLRKGGEAVPTKD